MSGTPDAPFIVGIVRDNDMVARIGGDEFAVILDCCDATVAAEIASRLVIAIKTMTVLHEGVRHSVGASIGIAEIDQQFADAAQWIAAADASCYRAKRAGRGQISTSVGLAD